VSLSTHPVVTIVVPSFNQGRFIRETIDSCLAQDYRPIEVLVFDGASTDNTVDVLRSYQSPELQWRSEKDRGVVDAVNKGLSIAKGDIISIQSTDDVFLPGAISAAVEAFHSNPQAGLAYGDVDLIDANSHLIGSDVQGPFDLAAYLGRLQYVPQPGAFFTRTAMLAAGSWRESVSYAADADYWMRIACRFPVIKLNRRMARYRYHDAQRDVQRARIERDWSQAVKDLLAHSGLDGRQRRFAQMGIHLARYRYAPPDAWWQRTKALYAALVSNPEGFLRKEFPKRELFPGRDPIWSALSRIKRRITASRKST
jgi:glycosyltransferase involved in cell wall biosynthesis